MSLDSPRGTGSPEAPAAAPAEPGRHRVVILGGGFGGLYAAQRLARAPVELTLVDRRNFHLFQPLLYQVATGGLSPGDIASPIRRALRKQRNARVLLGEAVGLETRSRRVELRDGERLPYDSLVVATGARHDYFGNADWGQRAPGLKSIEDATEMRRRILLAFERAEREPDAAARRALLNFVIVGAGPTGVELAGAICELARDTLRDDFRSIDPREARVLLLEGADRVLPLYPPDLSAKARASLVRLGAEVRVATRVEDLDEEGVTLASGGQRERMPARCVLWAAGVRASSVARILEKEAGAALDRAGRLRVEPDCSLPGHPEIFAIGDIAHFSHQGGGPLPGVAPVAMQQGRHVARVIARRLEGRDGEPFRYRDRGSLATIGRKAAVADFGRIRFSGFPAWLLWSAVHIFFLIEYENRVLVALRWLWSYVTRNRGTRLITGSADVA
jgi:NADH dehydrogenase